jgi:hypothetical protein
MDNKEWIYMIDGKKRSLIRVIFTTAVSAFAVTLAVDQLKGGPHKSLYLGLMFAVFAAFSLSISLRVLIRFLWFKIYIGENEFYCQTNPVNGKSYRYSDVTNARTEVKSSRAGFSHTVSQPLYVCYLCFNDNNGKTHKLLVEREIYEEEIDCIVGKINANRV